MTVETAPTDKAPVSKTARKRKASKRGPGQPTKYRKELGEDICERMACGSSLVAVLQAKDRSASGKSIYDCWPHLKGSLTVATVHLWVETHAEFSVAYARAFQLRADFLADEIVQIADESLGKSNAEVQRAKLRVDARKWTASKLRPDRYGERLDINQNINLQSLDDAALDDRIQRLLGMNGAVIEHEPGEE